MPLTGTHLLKLNDVYWEGGPFWQITLLCCCWSRLWGVLHFNLSMSISFFPISASCISCEKTLLEIDICVLSFRKNLISFFPSGQISHLQLEYIYLITFDDQNLRVFCPVLENYFGLTKSCCICLVVFFRFLRNEHVPPPLFLQRLR